MSKSSRPEPRAPSRAKPPSPATASGGRRSLIVIGCVAVAAVVVVIAVFGAWRWRTGGSLPFGSARRMNVLLVTLDTTRADHIGCYGSQRARTPRLDLLAAEGVRFADASSPAPITIAAHCSIFTALYPFEHGARNNGDFYLAPRFETLTTRLHAAGYRTAAFVSSFILDRRYGLARRFDVYDDRMDTSGQYVIDIEAERRGDRTVAALSAWLDSYSRDRSAPFLVWLHLYDPHAPYEPPSPFKESFADAPYDGEIAFDDTLVGSVLDKLGALGLRDDTLVVVAGDHGESLGDHGEEAHSMFVYESAIRVPFIVWKPGVVPAGVVVKEPVRLTDVAPTILDLLRAPGLPSTSGRSLVAAMNGTRGTPPPLYSETLAPQLTMNWAPLRSLRDERWKLIEAPRTELYDLQTDPDERVNRAAEQPNTVRALSDELARVAGSGQGAMSRAPVDAETRSRLAALGYIGSGSGAATRPDLAKARDPKDFILVYERLRKAFRAVRERRFTDALPILRETLAQDSDNAFAHQTLGDAYLGLGQDEKAIAEYRTYQNLVPPTPYIHHLVAICYLRLGQQEKALQEADLALSIDPKFVDARIMRGTVFEQRGQHDAAIVELRAATDSDPARPMIRLDLTNALAAAGRTEEAQREYEVVLGQQPDFPPALANLGALYMKVRKVQEASAVLTRALALDPSLQEARFNLARLYEAQGRGLDALAEYRRLVESSGTDADLRAAARARIRALDRAR